jgi:hypothetical protein
MAHHVHLASSLSVRSQARFIGAGKAGLSLFDFMMMGSTLSARSFTRLGSFLSFREKTAVGNRCVTGATSVYYYATFGSSMSTRSYVRLASTCSAINFMHVGSSLSLRAFARVGSALSAADFVSVGSAMSIRSFVRLGSTLSLSGTAAGTLRVGSGYVFYDSGSSSMQVFASEPGSSNSKASITFKA